MSVGGWDCHVHVFDGQTASRAGHYTPPRRSLQMLADCATPSGVNRFVFVQPSVYGSDNRLLLGALREGQGRHRGVVVIDDATDAAALEALHRLGVRGVRCNLVSPVGNSAAAAVRMGPTLRTLGWHVQWYARPQTLPEIAAFQARHRLTCVLDHLAGFTPAHTADTAAWAALRSVADGGGWLKLSGWYRLDATAPYAELDDTIVRAAALFGTRCVWGSDWPHTSFLEPGCGGEPPHYAQTWLPVQRALGNTHAERVLHAQPALLYP
jgi:predicted TIM-barrel fold metal-dependent hydrolase